MWVQAPVSLVPLSGAGPGQEKAGMTYWRPKAREEGLQVPEASAARTQQQFLPLDSTEVTPGYFLLFHTEDFSSETQFS